MNGLHTQFKMFLSLANRHTDHPYILNRYQNICYCIVSLTKEGHQMTGYQIIKENDKGC